jgi:hypothetical protein
MKNGNSLLLNENNCTKKRSWHDFSFRKKNPAKTLYSLDYGFCLFDTPIEKLDLLKIDVDSESYDPIYEKNARKECAEILYTIDDVIKDLTEKHFDVALRAFELESVILSPHFYQKIMFDKNAFNLKPYVINILEALYQSTQLLSLIRGKQNDIPIHSTLKKVSTLLQSHPWETFEESRAIIRLADNKGGLRIIN